MLNYECLHDYCHNYKRKFSDAARIFASKPAIEDFGNRTLFPAELAHGRKLSKGVNKTLLGEVLREHEPNAETPTKAIHLTAKKHRVLYVGGRLGKQREAGPDLRQGEGEVHFGEKGASQVE
eukprot:TRINITY_DN1250_c0_g1_i7.p2 TRINITY_DN1250_c0_g1~~TRINITY_DN1250_c0_g1_i7.p2  ORF type:complete len:122 (-),score=13.98 TRINITY_DN1250_c0_g1_i7:103-468(-)